ncbi:MAG: hypothetical protein KTR20_07965 [Cellvibrionaceae bacterium]|nr:hypothetical protein [Cellvibrionaceae bacterium]
MKPATKAALLCALVFPGSGQFYLKHRLRGLCFSSVAAIALFVLITAAIEVANALAAEIVSNPSALDIMAIHTLIEQSMTVFQQTPPRIAKAAIIVVWLWSSIDAYYLGKKIAERAQMP